MDLVVGGMASGKKEFVMREYGYAEAQIADGVIDARPVVYNLQDILRENPDDWLSLLPILREKDVVVCNEVGSGVVPISKNEAIWREATGRLCVQLAKDALRVVRVVCGLPTVVK